MKRVLLVLGLVALLVSPAMAERNMSGGYVQVVQPTGPLCPSWTMDFIFYVWNNSSDAEWVTDVILTFPACWEITGGGAYSDPTWSFIFSGVGTNVAHWADGDGGYGEIYGQVGGNFYVTVHICPDAMGMVPIHWFLQGDIWGSDPHFVEGDMFVEVSDLTPVQDSSWSQMKGLY